MKSWICALLSFLFLTVGCAKYHARPLQPAQSENQYKSRSLDDPGLRAFLDKNALTKPSQWPPPVLDLETLTSIAIYYSPELEVVRARARSADAALLTAKGRTNPSLASGAGYESSPEAVWISRFEPTFTLVTAGKKGYRVLQAEKLVEATRLELAESLWALRSRLRTALIDYLSETRNLELLREQLRLLTATVEMNQKRLAVGEYSRPEVTASQVSLAETAVAMRSSEGKLSDFLSTIAAIVGMPAFSLSNIRFAWPSLAQPAQEDPLTLDKIRQAGLLNRLDVRRALADYAAAEAALQLEIAKQYPDFEITSGYSFDEGHHKFMFGPTFAIPFPNRNQGPIAETEGRRVEAEARFEAVQARAINDMERAALGYRAAVAELAEAERAADLQRDLEKRTLRAFERGESDRLELTRMRLLGVATARAVLEAQHKLRSAQGALEDAVQRPLPSGTEIQGVSPENPRKNSAKESRP